MKLQNLNSKKIRVWLGVVMVLGGISWCVFLDNHSGYMPFNEFTMTYWKELTISVLIVLAGVFIGNVDR